jgi:S1-C subfamily serine protease
VDVAVFQVSVKDVPILPLFTGELHATRGGRIILLGYPTGLNAMLARAEPELVAEVLSVATNTKELIAELAKRGAISPVITQGALNEVRERRLVYDAETTSGGSGGPVFGPDGSVVGVNFAVTRDFGGSNFGVPIHFARPLLPAPVD